MISRLISAVIAFAVVIAILFGIVIYVGITKWHSKETVEVEIPTGSSARDIANILAKNGVIKMPKLFESYARIKGLGKKLKAGVYEFPAGTSLVMAMNKIEHGDVKQYAFTVIEGSTVKDIAASLVEKPFVASALVPGQFLKLATDRDYITQLGFAGVTSLDGYLFPDTYFITKSATADSLIKRFTARFNEVWNSLDGDAAKATGLSGKDIVTLASIVEKETASPDERPVIASVFYNRLKLGMPLQSDPTIIYGLPNYNGNIRKEDITNPHPYNTYVHSGLPPGPICNPGRASLEAVLNPANTKYLYFVSKNNGTHEFSETLSEHSRAVSKYQLQSTR